MALHRSSRDTRPEEGTGTLSNHHRLLRPEGILETEKPASKCWGQKAPHASPPPQAFPLELDTR